MLILKDKNGREVKVTVNGNYEDVWIEEAMYSDDPTEEVLYDTISFLQTNYEQELSDAFQTKLYQEEQDEQAFGD